MSYGTDLTFWLAVGYVLASTIASIIILVIAYKLVRGTRRLWTGMRAACGDDLKITLIGLGIATLMVSSVIPTFISAIISFSIDFISQLPNSLMNGWQLAQSCRAAQESSEIREPTRCVIELAYGFGIGWTMAIRGATRFSTLPFAQLLMLLAIWAAVGQLLAPTTEEVKGGVSQPKPWLVVAYNRIPFITRQNTLFFIFLAIAVYLSIAAIVAIPTLREGDVPSTLSVAKLEERMSQAMKVGDQFNNDYPEKVGQNPFIELEGRLATFKQAGDRAKELVTFMRSRRDEELKVWQQLRSEVLQRQGDLKTTGVATFEAESMGRKGAQETRQHFLDISSWFRSRVSDYYGRLRDCRSQIGATGEWWQQLANIAKSDLETGGRSFDGSFERTAFDAVNRTFAVCQLPVGDAWAPDRPRLGAFYGPFSFVASWLLQTESLPLTLITGLLGFGLLGSAVSTFVRERAKKQSDGPMVEDLAGVVIRGLSAAIVVFLAVMGGLVIFGGTSEPNPYVLFLTCLVGAVFSEEVWKWAHQWYEKKLGQKSDTGKETSVEKKPVPDEKKETVEDSVEEKTKQEEQKGQAKKEDKESENSR